MQINIQYHVPHPLAACQHPHPATTMAVYAVGHKAHPSVCTCPGQDAQSWLQPAITSSIPAVKVCMHQTLCMRHLHVMADNGGATGVRLVTYRGGQQPEDMPLSCSSATNQGETMAMTNAVVLGGRRSTPTYLTCTTVARAQNGESGGMSALNTKIANSHAPSHLHWLPCQWCMHGV